MQQGLAENNPVIGTARPAPETKRERVLSLDELRTIWLAAGDDDYGRIVRTLILTGQRRNEVGGMVEGELNREAAMWVLSRSRTKNGREHEVPLVPLALQIIGEPRPVRPYVFGRGRNGFSGWSQSKVRLDERIAATGAAMAPWTVHDLRRSFVTHMNEQSIAQPHIIEAVVNHISGAGKAGVAGVYNRAKYRAEKSAALAAWAAHVETIVARTKHGNVIAMARAAR
jgi:integrase